MILRRYAIRLAVCLGGIALTSCIDGREEVWLNANGGGRAELSYSLPAAAAKLHGGESAVRRLIKDFLESNPAISSSNIEVSTAGERLEIRVQAHFNALKLKEWSERQPLGEISSPAKFMAGEIAVRTQGLTIDFSRTISPGKAIPGAAFIPRTQIRGRSLSYIIHLPKAATESNATRIEDAGRTLIWECPLAEAIQTPVKTRFKAPIPLPWWATVVMVTVGGLLGCIMIMGFRKFRFPRPTPPAV